jgi:hypothetical protein
VQRDYVKHKSESYYFNVGITTINKQKTKKMESLFKQVEAFSPKEIEMMFEDYESLVKSGEEQIDKYKKRLNIISENILISKSEKLSDELDSDMTIYVYSDDVKFKDKLVFKTWSELYEYVDNKCKSMQIELELIKNIHKKLKVLLEVITL